MKMCSSILSSEVNGIKKFIKDSSDITKKAKKGLLNSDAQLNLAIS